LTSIVQTVIFKESVSVRPPSAGEQSVRSVF
jgi:hypothetical protein